MDKEAEEERSNFLFYAKCPLGGNASLEHGENKKERKKKERKKERMIEKEEHTRIKIMRKN